MRRARWPYPERARTAAATRSPTSTRDPLVHVAGAIAARAFRQRIDQLFDEIDALLCPVSSITAPPQVGDETIIAIFGSDHRSIIRLTRLTSFWDLAATPAISLPWGFDGDGLPLAVQLVTRVGTEEALLSIAARLEVVAPDRGRRPPLD
jgi:amidase